MTKRFVERACIALLFLFVAGCFPCLTRRLGSPDPRLAGYRILPEYIREYGCEPFRRINTGGELQPWCVAHGLGNLVVLRPETGCVDVPGTDDCEHFWACE